MKNLPNDLLVEVDVKSIIAGHYERLVANLVPSKRYHAIFLVNNEVEFVDYQAEVMGNWIHEYCRKQIAEANTFGVKKGEVRGIYYFANMFREAMEKFAKAYPKACDPTGRDYAFTFRFLFSPENDGREQNGGECWTCQAIEFFSASRTKATKAGCVVEHIDDRISA